MKKYHCLNFFQAVFFIFNKTETFYKKLKNNKDLKYRHNKNERGKQNEHNE